MYDTPPPKRSKVARVLGMVASRPWRSSRPYLRRRWLGGGLVPAALLLLVLATSSRATAAGPWQNRAFTYRLNSSAIQSNIPGLSGVSSGQLEWWAAYAVSTWKESSGIDFTVSYGGTSSKACDQFGDGESTVSASSGYYSYPWDGVLGWHQPTNQGGWRVESDICLYGGTNNGSWGTIGQNFSSDMVDFVGVLVHEFGHAYGVGHTTIWDAVMEPTHTRGSTVDRYPTKVDMQLLGELYPIRSVGIHWQQYDRTNAEWPTSNSYVSSANFPVSPSGAIGRDSSGSSVVVLAHVDEGLSGIRFLRSTYPLTTSSTWTNRYCGFNWGHNYCCFASRGLGIASNDQTTSPLWMAAWTTAGRASTLRYALSSNAFDNISVFELTDGSVASKSVRSPSVAFDQASGRFVVAYHQNATGVAFGKVIGRTYDPQVQTWSPEQDFGFWTTDGPAIACEANGDCIIAYARASINDPNVVIRKFSIASSDGTIAVGSSWTSSSNTQTPRSPVAGVGVWNVNEHWFGLHYTGTAATLANGVGRLWTSDSSTLPPPTPWSFDDGRVSSVNGFGLASGRSRDFVYRLALY